jgi:hypothetical protein
MNNVSYSVGCTHAVLETKGKCHAFGRADAVFGVIVLPSGRKRNNAGLY